MPPTAAFYFAPASSVHGTAEWVIYLEGGGWCYSAATCLARRSANPGLISSNQWPETLRLSGMFDRDPRRNPFAGVNLVFVGYCSSDAWVGDGVGTDGVNYQFRGQAILQALVTQLLNPAFSLTTAKGVVMAGCSEGARGVMANIDALVPLFPGGVQVRAVLDSPYELDVAPLLPADAATSLQNQTMAALTYVNASGALGKWCGAQYGETEPWKCLFGEYRLAFLESRYLASFSQFDSWQVPLLVGSPPPFDPAQLAYVDAVQRDVREGALALPATQQPGSAVYSSACYRHCTTASGAFWGVRVNNFTLAQYVSAWYFGYDGSPSSRYLARAPQVIEACSGFACGQCASLTTAAPAPPLPPARLGLRSPPYSVPPAPSTRASHRNANQLHSAKKVHLEDALAALAAVLLLVCVARPVFRAATKPSVLRAGTSGGGGGGQAELTPLVAAQRGSSQFYKAKAGALFQAGALGVSQGKLSRVTPHSSNTSL